MLRQDAEAAIPSKVPGREQGIKWPLLTRKTQLVDAYKGPASSTQWSLRSGRTQETPELQVYHSLKTLRPSVCSVSPGGDTEGARLSVTGRSGRRVCSLGHHTLRTPLSSHGARPRALRLGKSRSHRLGVWGSATHPKSDQSRHSIINAASTGAEASAESSKTSRNKLSGLRSSPDPQVLLLLPEVLAPVPSARCVRGAGK